MISIGVYCPKGGVGKTTTTINIGACLAKRGFKVAVVDYDQEQGSLTQCFNHEAIGVSCMQRMPKGGYDFVIVDYPPLVKQKPKVDLVVMPIQPGTLDQKSAKQAGKNVAGLPLIIVCNKLDERVAIDREEWLQMRNEYGALKINLRACIKHATKEGLTVFQMGKKHASHEGRRMYNYLVDQVILTLANNNKKVA